MEGAWIPDDLWNHHTSQAACIQIIFFLFRILFKSPGVLDCLSLVACKACRVQYNWYSRFKYSHLEEEEIEAQRV